MNQSLGTLYGIGVGPGDPEWLTLRGYRLIQTSPVLAYPVSPRGESMALGIVEPWLPAKGQERIGLFFPMTREREERDRFRRDAVQRLLPFLEQGKDVAFITEGDPLFYSTFGHLRKGMYRLNPEVPVEVVPGITSVHGTAARLGMPLVDGKQRMAVLPATGDPGEMEQALRTHDTVIFLKVARWMDDMISLLKRLNRLADACVVSYVSTPQETIHRDVSTLQGKRLPYFSLLLVKKSEGEGEERWAKNPSEAASSI